MMTLFFYTIAGTHTLGCSLLYVALLGEEVQALIDGSKTYVYV